MNPRIVVLRSPYHTMPESELAKKLFSEIIAIRIEGYRKYYQGNIMPVGAVDFLADHVVICDEDDDGQLMHLSSFKYITVDVCRKFDLTLPLYSVLSSPKNNQAVYHKVKSYIERFPEKKIAYCGSFVGNPRHKVRKNKKAIRDLTTTAIIESIKDNRIDEVFFFALKPSMKYFDYLGCEKFHPDLIKEKYIGDSLAYLERYIIPSEKALKDARPYLKNWEERLEI